MRHDRLPTGLRAGRQEADKLARREVDRRVGGKKTRAREQEFFDVRDAARLNPTAQIAGRPLAPLGRWAAGGV